jgi:1-deoxyxylulose-5-phosphate synthase
VEQRLVGRSDISITRLGLGCVTFGREIDEELSYQILDHTLSNGITLLDTAEGYGGGNAQLHRLETLGISDVRERTDELHSSEKIIGRWLSSRGGRERIVLQTKISGPYSPSRIKDAIDASLKRLQTDYIDLYLLHSYNDKSSPAETLEALDRALRAGKIRAAGCCNFSPDQMCSCLTISETRRLTRFEVIQSAYNLVLRGIEHDVIPFCRERDISIITYSPLGAGFLTGKYQANHQAIPKGSRFDIKPGHADIYFEEEHFRLVERLRTLSGAIGIPMARLALGWVLQNPNLTSVLIGATSPAHVDNGIEAMSLRLHSDWIRFILRGED